MALAAREDDQIQLHNRVETLVREAADLGLRLPDSFLRFMKSPELQARFRAGGAYWFFMSTRPARW